MTGGLRLVLDHDYTTGSAEDRTGHGNHGAVVGGTFLHGGGGLELDGRGDRVVVRPGPTLADITSLRVDVTALVHRIGARQNLVEGFLSFAVLLMEDGSVHGAVYDRVGWIAIRSAPGVVASGSWADVTYACDPAVGSHLYVGGALVAHGPRGPVAFGPVAWPFGLNVGGWPDADLFMLGGRVARVRVWIDDDRAG